MLHNERKSVANYTATKIPVTEIPEPIQEKKKKGLQIPTMREIWHEQYMKLSKEEKDKFLKEL